MMDELKAYLEPSSVNPVFVGVNKSLSLYSKIISLHQKGVEIQHGDIVIVGVNESRNSSHPSSQNSPNIIRQYLYALNSINIKGKIVDAGNIVDTSTPSQTYKALTNVISLIAQKEAIIVLIGGTQELTESIYNGYKTVKKLITLSIIDSHIDSDDDKTDFHSLNYLNKIVTENPSSLFDLSIIGYQGYFVDNSKIETFRKHNYELLRLGFVRGNYREVEPTLRNSDIVSFDLGVVRSSDSPGNIFPSPNGLYAEEACQLTKYAGTSDRTSCFGIFEYFPEKDQTKQTALLCAQLIWHFIEGVSQRISETSLKNTSHVKKFIVNTGTPGVDIVFYKNDVSDNWWFEVPVSKKNKTFGSDNIITPCSPNDYLLMSKQEIPERWLRFFQKAQAADNESF